MSLESNTSLTVDDVAILEYLQNNPGFFARNPDLLTELKLPNPHGDGVISLSTRQIGLLRAQLDEKSKLLENLISFGKTNDAINTQIHQLSLKLITVSDMNTLHAALDTHIKQAFDLSHASIHQLDRDPVLPETFTNWIKVLNAPYCSNEANAAIKALIDSNTLPPDQGSFSIIPMFATENKSVIAFILLAAKDRQHFTQSMETDFLTRIGELFNQRLNKLDSA